MAGNQTLPFQFRPVRSRPLVQPLLALLRFSTESEKLLEKAGANLIFRPGSGKEWFPGSGYAGFFHTSIGKL